MHIRDVLGSGIHRITTKAKTVFAVTSAGILGITASLMLVGSASAVGSTVVYNNIANPQPSNVPSVGFEATSTSEFGGIVQLAGTNRTDPQVTVLMSSWGCESGGWSTNDCVTTDGASFTHPITINVYAVAAGNAPGAVLASSTKTFTFPYRPSQDTTNCSGGQWYDGTSCFSGKAVPITFDLSGVTLPDSVIIGVAYNTTHFGAEPMGTNATCYTESGGCGYDSLNVGAKTSLSVGSQPLPDDAYLNSTWAGAYCGGSTGTFRLDMHTTVPECNWTGYQPSFSVTAGTAYNPPTSKDQCKKDGWMTFANPVFKNQGDCVSFVATGGKVNLPNF